MLAVVKTLQSRGRARLRQSAPASLPYAAPANHWRRYRGICDDYIVATNTKNPDMVTAAKARSVKDKWGPSEWFGIDVFAAKDATRLAIARDAKKKFKDANRICPYQTALVGAQRICSKAGGICSV